MDCSDWSNDDRGCSTGLSRRASTTYILVARWTDDSTLEERGENLKYGTTLCTIVETSKAHESSSRRESILALGTFILILRLIVTC